MELHVSSRDHLIRRTATALLAGACALAVACGRPEPQATTESAGAAGRPNVVLVMVDTLRADHMSLHGYERPTTPFLDRFASRSVVFEQARSQAACTYPSVNSLLTSQWANRFYSAEGEFFGIPDDVPSMPSVFKAAGYHTAAVSASPIVRASPSKHNPDGGFEQGFDVFDEQCLWQPAACVNRRAEAVLEELEEPFFLYLHYMDPHGHYQPPKEHVQQFTKPYDGHDFIAAGDHNPIASMLYDDGDPIEISDRDMEHLLDLYDEEILYFDGQFGNLVERFEADGLLDRSIVVVTSDHGEEFLEHDHIGHCRGIWNTLTWVPLVVSGPGVPTGRRVDGPVQLVDVLPTLLELTAVDAPDLEPVGASLATHFDGLAPAGPRYAFSDQSRYRGCDDGTFHLIMDGVEKSFEMYDMVDDPAEQVDIFSPSNPDGERLALVLGDWLEDSGQWLRLEEALADAAEKEEMLRALGYLE